MITDIAGVNNVKQQIWREATRTQTQTITCPQGNLVKQIQLWLNKVLSQSVYNTMSVVVYTASSHKFARNCLEEDTKNTTQHEWSHEQLVASPASHAFSHARTLSSSVFFFMREKLLAV